MRGFNKIVKKATSYVGVCLLLATFVTGTALAQELIIYPAKGQSQDQMEKDKFECYSWAKKESGFDPMQPPQATEAPPQQEAQKGGAGRGAARGAAVGYVGGKIVSDSGSGSKGAKAGAATGALVGGMRRRDQSRQQQQAEQQWAQEQAAQYSQNRNSYNRAYSACLEGRGYTVK